MGGVSSIAKKKSVVWQLFLGFVIISLLLAGCGQKPQSAKPNETAKTETGEKIIVDGLFEEPNKLNPILGPSMTYQTMVLQTMFSGLVTIKPDGSMVPDLATEVPSVGNGLISKDGLTYTFKLKKGVTWSDGQSFTSQDVKFTWETIMNPDVVPLSTVGYDQVASVETPDASTVVFHLKKPYPPFLSRWAGPIIIPEHVWSKVPPKEINNSEMNIKPKVTLGPFNFGEWVNGDHITMVKNPKYFGEPAKVDKIVFRIIPDQNAQLAAIQNGDINVYYFAPITQYKQLQNISGVDIHLLKVPVWWEHMVINLKNPILQDIRVRQALNYAIDKNVLINQVWQGLAVASSSPIAPATWAAPKDLEPYPFDPKKAAQLLEEAGWKMGSDGYRHKDGKVLELVISTTAKNPWREQSEKIFQDMYKSVGIKLTIRNVDAATFFGSLLKSGKPGTEQGGWDLAEFQSATSYDPGVSLAQRFHTRSFPDKGGSNYGYYANPEVDKLLDKVNTTVDEKERLAMFRQLAQSLRDDPACVYLYLPYEINATRGMTGYVPTAWGVDTWNVATWQKR